MTLGLSDKIKRHLIETVGKKPTKKEMNDVDEQIKPIFAKIYHSPNKASSFIKKAYDSKLSKLWIKVVANESFLEEIRLFAKFTKIKSNYNLTSLASGLGVYEMFLAREYLQNGKISCIDLSEGMSKIAKEFAKKIKQRNVKIIVASAIKLPIKPNSQDIVLARRTGLSNDKKWIKVLKEANRIIKKENNSTFIFTVDKSFNKSSKEVKSDLKKANFNLITIRDFNRGSENTVSMVVAKPIFN